MFLNPSQWTSLNCIVTFWHWLDCHFVEWHWLDQSCKWQLNQCLPPTSFNLAELLIMLTTIAWQHANLFCQSRRWWRWGCRWGHTRWWWRRGWGRCRWGHTSPWDCVVAAQPLCPPSLLLLPGSSINNSPGNQKPLLPCSSPLFPFPPSFIHCWCTDHHQESLWSEMEVEVEEEEEGKDEKEEVVKEEK